MLLGVFVLIVLYYGGRGWGSKWVYEGGGVGKESDLIREMGRGMDEKVIWGSWLIVCSFLRVFCNVFREVIVIFDRSLVM